MADNLQHMWSDHDSSSSRLGSAASFFGDSMSYSSGILTENSSLFSMSEDDFDHLATLKAREMFEEVDRVLYENSGHESQEMTRECEEWKAKFPHLRIVGQKILDSTDHGFRRYSPTNATFNGVNSKMKLERSSDLNGLMNGLTVKGEKLSTHLNGESTGDEETIDFDGDYEEIIALDYNSEEKRNMHGLMRGYPPITPINSMRDFIISSICNKILADLSAHVVELILQCKSKQIALSDERSRGKENVGSNRCTLDVVLPPKPSLSPVKNWNCEIPSLAPFVSSWQSFPFKPSDLQVVPEDSGLDPIVDRRMKSARERLFSPPRFSLHPPEQIRTPARLENHKSNSFPLHLSGIQQSPRSAQKVAEGGKMWVPGAPRTNPSKRPLPHINQKPLAASNDNVDRVTRLQGEVPQRTNSALHSGQDARFSTRQHLNLGSRFGEKLSYKFDTSRPSSTRTYYNSKIDSKFQHHSPPLNSCRSPLILPDLNDHRRLHSGDALRRCRDAKEPTLRPLTNKQHLRKRKSTISSTMPQIPDSHAGSHRGIPPSRSRTSMTPFR